MKPTNLLLFPIIILCSFTSVKEIPPYKNPALPVDERVKDLLGENDDRREVLANIYDAW